MGFCTVVANKLYFLSEEWIDEERATFDITDFEMIAYDYDMAYKFTPIIAPEYFARMRLALGRVENEGVRHALQGQRSKKGVLDLGTKSILCSQVRHHFVLRARQSLHHGQRPSRPFVSW
jgi:hypothetical protein